MIRLTVPTIEDDDVRAVEDALRSGYLVQGERVAAFEAAVAAAIGVGHAVAVSSGTAALHLALLATGVGPGDRVVTTAYSWPATANVIELCGATPVFVDVDPTTSNMAPASLEAALRGEAPRAVLPVHPFGSMAGFDNVARVAATASVPVIEDAACALGASLGGARAGTCGRAACFSFHPRKAVTTGEGGVVTTDDDQVAEWVRGLRDHGQARSDGATRFVRPGFNYRLSELHAALGITQMAKLDRVVDARRAAAARYLALLDGTPIEPQASPPGSQPVYQSYVVLLPEGVNRDAVIADMRRRGVETTIGTWHIPLTDYYRERYGYEPGDFPGADLLARRALTLPLFPGITETEQEHVIAALTACTESARDG